MKKCIIVDIDGTLADSEKWQKEYFCSGFHDEDGYMEHISHFPVSKWLEKLIGIYWAEYYDIFILTARHVSYRGETKHWLKHMTIIETKVRDVIYRTDITQDASEFKLEKVKLLSLYNDVEIIFDDNPKTVKLLQDNGFNAVLVKSLY